MDDNKWFKLLWRVNAVLALLVLLGVLVQAARYRARRLWPAEPMMANFYQMGVDAQGNPVVEGKWRYGQPYRVPGESQCIVPLHSVDDADDASRYHEGPLRNLLFLTSDLKTARWLLPDNGRKIADWSFLQGKGNETTLGILLKLEDHTVTQEEPNTTPSVAICLCRPDCTGFTQVLDGVTRVIGSQVIADNSLLIFYVKDGAGHAARIATSDFTVVGRTRLDLQD